jgi:L-Ala-D/L-Glu epimerase
VIRAARIDLIEQPFAVGSEPLLDGFDSPIPVAADESVQDGADLPGLAGRFDVVNIKLDKCGGLTEGLAMAGEALKLGLKIRVDNTVGTSLAMAPGFLLGQLCAGVDLDGPVFLRSDRPLTARYENGMIYWPEDLWGGADGRRLRCFQAASAERHASEKQLVAI